MIQNLFEEINDIYPGHSVFKISYDRLSSLVSPLYFDCRVHLIIYWTVQAWHSGTENYRSDAINFWKFKFDYS